MAVAAPDGGWGWVVMVASFFNNVLVSGILKSGGVLYMSIMDTMDVSRTEAALVPGVMFGVTSFLAPVATSLSARFSPKVVVFAGGLVAALGLAVASITVSSITFTTVAYGLIVGFGCGLIFVPNIVVVYSYFDRRRAFASSFGIAGGSIGLFVVPPLVEYVAQEHGLRATFLTLSAVVLHVCPAALLFRPLDGSKVKRGGLVAAATSPMQECKDLESQKVVMDPKKEADATKEESVVFLGPHASPTTLSDPNANLESRYTLLCPLTMPISNSFTDRKLVDIAKEAELLNCNRNNDETEVLVDSVNDAQYGLVDGKYSKGENQIKESHHSATNNNDTSENAPGPKEETILFLDPTKAKSRDSLAKFETQSQKLSEVVAMEKPRIKNWCNRILRVLSFDASVFREKYFIFLMLTMFSFAFTWSGYLTLVPDYAYHEAADTVTKTMATLLLSAMTAGDATFRIVFGWLSDRGWMRLEHFFIIGLFLTGTVLSCYALSLTYTFLLVISVIYGAVVSVVIVLPPLLLNHFLGPKRFPMGYALCSCASGVAVFCSPPILAYVREVYGSYKPCFLTMGLLLIACGVVWLTDELLNYLRRTKTLATEDKAQDGNLQCSSC